MLAMLTPDSAAKHGNHDPTSPSSCPSPANSISFLSQIPLVLLGSYLHGQTPSPSPAARSADDAALQKEIMINAHEATRPGSSASSAATVEKPQKRAPRPKTTYMLKQPPPTVNPYSKLHIRPKVLLQLHQVLAAGRPKPVYEVIPFSLVNIPSARRLARTFNTRERLGPSDFLIVKTEEYGSKADTARSDDEGWASRDIIAVLCPGKAEKGVLGKTEICIDDGTSRWEVTNLPNGGCEFNTTTEHGQALKARWILKTSTSRRWSGMSLDSEATASSQEDNKKYTFSTISPDSRRHPIIATMARAKLDVLDSYTMPSATSPPTPTPLSPAHDPVLTPASIDIDSFLESGPSPSITTDDALRKFIVVSAIWVSYQSWRPDAPCTTSSGAPQNVSTNARPLGSRTVSMSNFIQSRPSSPSSTANEKRLTLPSRLSFSRLSRASSFTDVPPSPMSTKTAIVVTPPPAMATRSRRANTVDATNVKSISGSMRQRYARTFDQTLPETDEERQTKRSVELLRTKELLTSPIERPSVENPSPTLKSLPTQTTTPVTTTPLLQSSLQVPKPDPRVRKTQSVCDPITTAGMWDSGVAEGPGLKARPTSMFVMNERKRKQGKKRGRAKDKDVSVKVREKSESDSGARVKSDWSRFKKGIKGMFKKAHC